MKNKDILKIAKDKSASIKVTSEAFCSAIDNAWSSNNTRVLQDISEIYTNRYKEHGIDKVISLVIQEASPLALTQLREKEARWKGYWRPLIIEKGLAELVSLKSPQKKNFPTTCNF